MADEDELLPELTISLDKIEYIILKAREFDVKVAPTEPDPGSNPTDDGEGAVLEDYPDDPTAAELRAAIETLNEDEVIELIALTWLGRGDFDKSEWDEAKAMADERHRRSSADYLLGIPNLSDCLEEGVAALGYSLEDAEAEHL